MGFACSNQGPPLFGSYDALGSVVVLPYNLRVDDGFFARMCFSQRVLCFFLTFENDSATFHHIIYV